MLVYLQDYLSLDPSQAVRSPVFWSSLFVVSFILCLWWLLRSSKKQVLAVFCDEEGAVQITPQALRELVRKSCAEIPGVHSPTTKIYEKSKVVRLLVKLRVEPDCKVKQIRNQLREKLDHVMVENLNFSNFGGVDIIIKGFQDSR